METKICSKCGRELPLDRFESGRNQYCRNARRKELRDANPEKHRGEEVEKSNGLVNEDSVYYMWGK